MEQRRTERVQFFNLRDEQGVHPVWVFHRSGSDAALGLVVNISCSGALILASKDTPLQADVYKLTVFIDQDDEASSHCAIVSRKWSEGEGTLYLRHGFAFEDELDVSSGVVQAVIAARDAGTRWFRCELLDLSAPDIPLAEAGYH